jgi:K+-transporting ATPase KdpF subunit
VNIEFILGGIVSFAVLIYLLVALALPERF